MNNKSSNNDTAVLKSLKVTKAIWPVLIGLFVVIWMFLKEYQPGALQQLNTTKYAFLWLLVAFLCMIIRDFGYMLRIRILTDNRFTWLQSFRIIMLWEFTSAITPSAIGGTSLAILFVNKEGLSVGKSSAIVMATSFLDELYFILVFPLLVLLVDQQLLFKTGGQPLSLNNKYLLLAMVGYSIKLIYLLVLSYGLFKNPRGLKWLLLMIFKLPFLRRWKHGANAAGTEIITSSVELRKKPFVFWLKAFAATIFSWTSRFWVVNAMFLAFFSVSDHFLIFGRQLVMWIVMLVSPTPGGSGFVEYVFSHYLSDFIPIGPVLLPAIAVALAFLWRIISYYPYLIIGAIIVPRWIRQKFTKK
ncbi:MAG TPA: lysylphosphatidylglycerol synthase transmembrane domain-containing protein [Salinivirgaceae bacterium]|nr:lysylphosphatidylglycerol synthase transmembrane domain-containing protein [Salinivirgaceae bacterium]